jgi:hypothetical protein
MFMSDVFSLGSVQYSVLPPKNFLDLPENKGKWVLMDGQSIHGSALWNLTQMENVPDGRGVFIRSMNVPKIDEDMSTRGDTELTRTVGSFQGDSLKKHAHNLSAEIGFFGGWGGSNLFSGGTPGSPMSIGNQGKTAVTIQEFGKNLDGEETRPRNIALYVYIKINN